MAENLISQNPTPKKRGRPPGHGMSGSPEYRAWIAMRVRCTKTDDPAYGRYGGRGITVDPEWMNSFDAFIAHMGPRPSPRHTLERLDNELGYGPDNCHWAVWEDQNRNRRNTVFVEHRGERRPLAELCEVHKVDYGRTWRRIFTFGWSPERALAG